MSKVASIVDVLQGKIAIGEKLPYADGSVPVVILKRVFLSLQFMTALALTLFKQLLITILKIMRAKSYSLTTGCSVIVTGIIVESPAEGQTVELKLKK